MEDNVWLQFHNETIILKWVHGYMCHDKDKGEHMGVLESCRIQLVAKKPRKCESAFWS